MVTREIELSAIDISDFNTRKDLDAGTEEADLDGLASSIRERGLLQAIIVRTKPGGRYDLIAGQRRFLACDKLGMTTIRADVRDDLGDNDATVVSLIENVQRADMHPLDKAKAYKAIHEQYGDYKQVAKETGVTVPTIRKYLYLLDLDSSIQEFLTTTEGSIGIGTLSKLAELFPPEQHAEVLEKVRGFRQDIQLDILKRSKGDIDLIDALADEARENAFLIRTCIEGLCFAMSVDLKREVVERLQRESGE